MGSLVLGFSVFRSQRFVVVLDVAGERSKVLRVFFSKRGGVYIDLPYFKHRHGVLGEFPIPTSVGMPTDVNLHQGGRTTSHPVKYAHYFDGEAHFSQDGRVFTSVRKRAAPLSQVEGHLFSVYPQGVSDFERPTRKDQGAADAKRMTLSLDLDGASPGALKILGHWYSRSGLAAMNQGMSGGVGPWVAHATPSGDFARGFLAASPVGTLTEDWILMLTCEAIPQLTTEPIPLLLFAGGFDPKEELLSPSKTPTALFLKYGVTESDPDELARLLGTIDLPRDLLRGSSTPS